MKYRACGMGEVQAADARRRRHRGVLGQIDADAPRVEQIEQLELLAVVGARRIAEAGPDAAMRSRR